MAVQRLAGKACSMLATERYLGSTNRLQADWRLYYFWKRLQTCGSIVFGACLLTQSIKDIRWLSIRIQSRPFC
jgi:hypothetical protein